jgi:CRP-like cAMP-binding protein
VSGKNKILKPGDMLFRVGEASNGMYVIRRGQVLVYLDKGGVEIPLATIGAGAMLGEMSLFDKKPRSASARLIEEVELTQITNDEFTKILQQIPKWFVALMSTLSSRLRDTNERLQDLEAKYKGNLNPFEELIKTLHILQLLWYKLGTKEVKSWSLDRQAAEDELSIILNLDQTQTAAIIDTIVGGGLINASKNQYKKDVLVILNRGDLDRFIDFVTRVRKKNNAMKFLPQEFVDIIDMLARLAKATAYDTFSIDSKQLETEARNKGFRTEKWSDILTMMMDVDESLVITKGAKDISFKVQKKSIETLLNHARILRGVTRSAEKKQNKAA